MELEMVVFSDNDSLECVANILHDSGYRTAGIIKESIGKQEEKNEWNWAKLNMIDSVCVDINSAIGRIVPTEQVEEKPLFRYVAVFIVGDDDDTDGTAEQTEEEEQEEQEMTHDIDNEKNVNVVMNIGMTTKNGVKIDCDSAIDKIGAETDCTITRCVGFYKGHREDSLRVDMYDTRADIAVSMASYFAHLFMQECVAVTVNGKTVFVNDDYTDTEFVEWCDALEK